MNLFPFYELREFKTEGRGCCQRQQQRSETSGVQQMIVKLPILYVV
jgi:hypothetical protein